MKTVIHVNQYILKKNLKSGNRNPPLTIKTYKDNRNAHEVVIDGPCRIVYRPDKPLSCGAVCWVETEANVHLEGMEDDH